MPELKFEHLRRSNIGKFKSELKVKSILTDAYSEMKTKLSKMGQLNEKQDAALGLLNKLLTDGIKTKKHLKTALSLIRFLKSSMVKPKVIASKSNTIAIPLEVKSELLNTISADKRFSFLQSVDESELDYLLLETYKQQGYFNLNMIISDPIQLNEYFVINKKYAMLKSDLERAALLHRSIDSFSSDFFKRILSAKLGKLLREQNMSLQKVRQFNFMRWLDLLFIKKGYYKVTDFGLRVISDSVVRKNRRLYLELSEPQTQKTRDTDFTTVGLSKSQLSQNVIEYINSEIESGNIEQLYDSGMIRCAQKSFKDMSLNVFILTKFFKAISKPIMTVTAQDLILYGLGNMLVKFNGMYEIMAVTGNVYSENEIAQFFKDGSYPRDKYYPWDLLKMNQYNKNMKKYALDWVLKLTNKKPEQLTISDLKLGPSGALGNSPYSILVECGYAYSVDEIKKMSESNNFENDKLYPWELDDQPEIYNDKQLRVAMLNWYIFKFKIKPENIIPDEFYKIIKSHVIYYSSFYELLVDANYAYSYEEIKQMSKLNDFGTKKIYPWELKDQPKIFLDKDLRIAAIRWYVSKYGVPRYVNDVYRLIPGLIRYYSNSSESSALSKMLEDSKLNE